MADETQQQWCVFKRQRLGFYVDHTDTELHDRYELLLLLRN
jgi:hypothetical protein